MTCFCNDHQTLFLNVNIYLPVSLGKPFELLQVHFECEELSRKHKNWGEVGVEN